MLAEDVLRFLRSSIGSVWTLELLLLMHREAGRDWSIDGLTRELRSSVGIVTSGVMQLGGAGLVKEAEGRYRYHPSTPELDALVARVAASYAKLPFAVTQAILTAPNHKIQLFADAFRVKSKEE